MWPAYPPPVTDPPVLPLMGVMTSDETLAELALEALKPMLGPPAIETPRLPFDYTDYYENEMGSGLKRWYVAFSNLMFAQEVVEFKYRCAKLEADSAVEGRRRINLDPGYVDLAKVVLASWKEGNYKIYLRDGVWADPVLMFEKGRFITQPWSFPDLREGVHQDFFVKARNLYKRLMREHNETGSP